MKRKITALLAALLCFALNTATVNAVSVPEDKIAPEVIEAMNDHHNTIPVTIWYTDVDKTELQDRLYAEAQEYGETLDRSEYTDQQIEQIWTDYYLKNLRDETKKLYAESAAKLAKELGLDEGSYSCGTYAPVLGAMMTPEQITEASANEIVTEITLNGIEAPTEVPTDSANTSEKFTPELIEALSGEHKTIPVSIWYENVDTTDLQDRLYAEAQEYGETLDRSKYTDLEIERMRTDYYLRRLREETKKLYADSAAQLAKSIGIKDGSYTNGTYAPVLSAVLTPEQINQAATLAIVSEIALGGLSPSEETPTEVPSEDPTEPTTELPGPKPVYGDFNHDGVVNASDAAVILIYSAKYGAGQFGGSFEEYVKG